MKKSKSRPAKIRLVGLSIIIALSLYGIFHSSSKEDKTLLCMTLVGPLISPRYEVREEGGMYRVSVKKNVEALVPKQSCILFITDDSATEGK